MHCKLITTTSNISKCAQLKRSLDYFGWDYHFIEHEWHGFGDKVLKTYEYLKANPDITHFFCSDAWDTFALGTMEEALSRIPNKAIILQSAERACYPHGEKAALYPDNQSPWKYVNGGGWFANSKLFIAMVDKVTPDVTTVDQVYFTDRFLEGTHGMQLDYDCEVFQTIAFCPESDFKEIDCALIENELVVKFKGIKNTVTKSHPIFFHGNGHTPMPHIYKLLPMMQTLKEAAELWQDTPESHKMFNDTFTENVNADPKLKKYRDFVEGNNDTPVKIFGFGERSFLWMWKLIVGYVIDPMIPHGFAHPEMAAFMSKNEKFSFLEIGVFRGQILGLIRMLAPKAKITGITPLDSTGDHWESDYAADIALLHKTFKLKQPKIIKGLSTDENIISEAGKELYDIIYVDGGHDFETAHSDVFLYSSFVKVGGFLVIDDCAHKYNMPDGYFKGIESVSRAVDSLLPNEYYKEILSVVHNRVFKRIK